MADVRDNLLDSTLRSVQGLGAPREDGVDERPAYKIIHLIEVKPCNPLGWFYAHCACQWDSKGKRTHEAAAKSGLLHVEAARKKR